MVFGVGFRAWGLGFRILGFRLSGFGGSGLLLLLALLHILYDCRACRV